MLETKHQDIHFDAARVKASWSLYVLSTLHNGLDRNSMAVFDPSFPTENLTQLTKIRDLRTWADMRRVGKPIYYLKTPFYYSNIYMRWSWERKCSRSVWPWKGPLGLCKRNSPEKGCWVERCLRQRKEINLIIVENQSWSQSTSM